jgi:hypothetical protein
LNLNLNLNLKANSRNPNVHAENTVLDRRGRWIAGDAAGPSRVPKSVKGKRRQEDVDPSSSSPRHDLEREDEQASVAETELNPVEEGESTPRPSPKKKRKYKHHHIPSDGPSSPFKASPSHDGLGLPSSVRPFVSPISLVLCGLINNVCRIY